MSRSTPTPVSRTRPRQRHLRAHFQARVVLEEVDHLDSRDPDLRPPHPAGGYFSRVVFVPLTVRQPALVRERHLRVK